MNTPTNTTNNARFRQVRFIAANKASEQALKEQLKQLLKDHAFKLTFSHHSHQLTTNVHNAKRYNTDRSNGITLVILQTTAFPRPIYHQSICDKEDTYSRLLGRVYALENLLNSIKNNTYQELKTERKFENSPDRVRPWMYHNQIIAEKHLERKVPKKVKPYVHPLTFINEDSLVLKVKQHIAAKFGVDTNLIETYFSYVRKYDNKFFGNQLGTYEYITEQQNEYPDDEVILRSTGGYVVGAIKFEYEGSPHILYSTSECHDSDHFNKAIGRRTVFGNIVDSNIFKEKASKRTKSKLTGIYKLSADDMHNKDELMKHLTVHAIAERFGYTANTYVGSDSFKV